MRIGLIFVVALFFIPTAQSLAQPAVDRLESRLLRQGDDEVKRASAVEPGFLGVRLNNRPSGAGVLVSQLLPDGPAAKGGLRTGDLITAVDGNEVANEEEMKSLLTSKPAGSRVEFQVTRNEGPQKLQITLGKGPPVGQRAFAESGPTSAEADGDEPGPLPTARPAGAATASATSSGPKLGVRTLPVTEDTRRQYNLPSAGGALVVAVSPGSPAEKARIPAGAVITSLDAQKVNVPEDLSDITKRAGVGRPLEVTYLSRGQQMRATVTLSDEPLATGRPTLAAGPSAVPTRALQGAPSSAGSRVEMLEQRIRDLEERIARLEGMLERGK